MSVTPLSYSAPGTALAPLGTSGPDRAAGVLALLGPLMDLAERVANTEFVPKDLRRRPEAVLAALMTGAERGLGPMESLRSIHVIEGKPSFSAEALRALVLAAGHEIQIVENTAQKATLLGRRRGAQEWSPPFTWTIDRARRANLVNKDNWRKYPEDMLLARASTALCRAVFPDVVAGLSAVEEADDVTELVEVTTTRKAPSKRAAAALAAAPAAPAPAAVPAGPPVRSQEPSDGIPGSDRPSWGRPPQETTVEAEASAVDLSKRIHAEVGSVFKGTPKATQDRWRHALCAVVTRKRPDGPVASSAELDTEEQLALSTVLREIAAGRASVTDGPDAVVELRAGGWTFAVTLDPLTVAVTAPEDADSNDPDPDQEVPT